MEVPDLNLKECESIFVRDDFYENIQAPKFHDFCSNEDPLVDAEEYFRRLGGISPRPSTDPFADQNGLKVAKEPTILKPPGLPKAPLSSVALNTDVVSSVPKASSAGLKKAKPSVPMLSTTLTKCQEKAPTKNKMYQRVNSLSNATLSLTVSDGSGTDFVKSDHESVNSDPNGTSQSRRPPTDSSSSKYDEGNSVAPTAGSVVQPIACTQGGPNVDANVGTERTVMVEPQNNPLRNSKGKFSSPATRVLDPGSDHPDLKDKKRKPGPRSVDAGAVKANDARNRVLKLQKKNFTPSESDGDPGASEPGLLSYNSGRNSCGEAVAAKSVKPPTDRRSSRRNSDNRRRRRASGGQIARQARRALMMAPKPDVVQEIPGTVSVSTSLPMRFGSAPTSKQRPERNSVAVGVSLSSNSVSSHVSSYRTVVSRCSVHAMEVSRMEDEGCPNFDVVTESISGVFHGNSDCAGPSVQALSVFSGTAANSDGKASQYSADELLLERMEKLQLHQDESQAVRESESNDAPEMPAPVTSAPIVHGSSPLDDRPPTGSQQLSGEDSSTSFEVGMSASAGPTDNDAECRLNTSEEPPTENVVPSESQGELNMNVSTASLDMDLAADGTISGVCSGEEVSAGTNSGDMVQLMQNLQIQSTEFAGYRPPGHGAEANVVSPDLITTGGDERPAKTSARGNADDEDKSEIRSGHTTLECESDAPSILEVETEPNTRPLQRSLSQRASRVANCSDSSRCNPSGPHLFMNEQQKRSNKRKSIELVPQRNEPRSVNVSTDQNADEQRKAKVTSQSSLAPLAHSQLSASTARSAVSTVGSVQHKKLKATCPQPFRLRTEERGAVKEVEFNKKVELYMAEKEKMRAAPFQFTMNSSRIGVKEPRNLSKDSKAPGRKIYHRTQTRAADRAQFDMKMSEKSLRADEEKQEREKRMQREAEEEIKRMRKQMIPHAHRMPFFDRPFKPHRSTKSLTVPNSPKFHTLKSKKTTAQSTLQE